MNPTWSRSWPAGDGKLACRGEASQNKPIRRPPAHIGRPGMGDGQRCIGSNDRKICSQGVLTFEGYGMRQGISCKLGVGVFRRPGSVVSARCSGLGADPARVPGAKYPAPGTRYVVLVFEKPAHGVYMLQDRNGGIRITRQSFSVLIFQIFSRYIGVHRGHTAMDSSLVTSSLHRFLLNPNDIVKSSRWSWQV